MLRLQSRCEQLEKEVEWVKSERDEAVKAAEAAATRQKESEAAAARAKNTRRDDLKKDKKDRNALQHRAEVGFPACKRCNCAANNSGGGRSRSILTM